MSEKNLKLPLKKKRKKCLVTFYEHAYRKELPYDDSHWQKILEQRKMKISILPCILSVWFISIDNHLADTDGERVTKFLYDVIAVCPKWRPVSWMAGKAGLLWSTVFFFFWQIYKAYCIGNGERSFPQREAYFFKSYYFSSVKILQKAVECIRQESSERDEMSFITIHFGGKHSSSLALN